MIDEQLRMASICEQKDFFSKNKLIPILIIIKLSKTRSAMQFYKIPTEQKPNQQKYQPLRWPPDLNLAKTHMKCVCPGKDNIQGIQCPCCGKMQKIQIEDWYCRDIFKDFKSYGGGIPCYFSLIKYCIVSLLILAILVNAYHTVMLITTCPKIQKTLSTCKNYTQTQLQTMKCQTFLEIFYIVDSKIIYETLSCLGEERKLDVYFYIELFSYVYLVSVTIGMKLWVERTNSKQIVKHQKLFSLFALILKNIPKYYSIQDLKNQILKLLPQAQICQLFFVYEIAELETQFKTLFDLHYQIQYKKQEVLNNKGDKAQQLEKMVAEYKELFEKFQELKNNMNFNNGRAIVVFNKVQYRDQLHQMIKINQCTKLTFNTMKMLSINTKNLQFFSDPLPQPKQVIWKYIGESQITKNWLRVRTTMLGFGFMILAFLLLYYPILWIDAQKSTPHSLQITILASLISFILQMLSISYRLILLKLLPSRQPSSRQNQSYFVTMSTITFHFFFYILAPITYFVIESKIPANLKLKQLFITIFFFLFFTLVIAFLDIRYRIFKNRRERIMSSQAGWGKFCQLRLHQQIRWPSFPIQFKLMVIFDIWSFNAFYIFQVPYLLILFFITLIILYWNDKRVLYKHYKMQVYQSIDIQISVQRDYIYMFLICASCGYAVGAKYDWQYMLIAIVFVLAVFINYIISYNKSQQFIDKNIAPLVEFVKAQSINLRKTFSQTNLQSQLKHQLLIQQDSQTESVGSAIIHHGYRQIYETYLKQFKNINIIKMLMETNQYISNPDFSVSKELNISFWMDRTRKSLGQHGGYGDGQGEAANSLSLENTEKSRIISDLSSAKSRNVGKQNGSIELINRYSQSKDSNFYLVIEPDKSEQKNKLNNNQSQRSIQNENNNGNILPDELKMNNQ